MLRGSVVRTKIARPLDRPIDQTDQRGRKGPAQGPRPTAKDRRRTSKLAVFKAVGRTACMFDWS